MNSQNLRINNCKTYSESPIEMPTLDELFTPLQKMFFNLEMSSIYIKKINELIFILMNI